MRVWGEGLPLTGTCGRSRDKDLHSLNRRPWRRGATTKGHIEGLELEAKGWDPRESRRMVAWLTPEGKQVVGRLLETVPYPA